jgi:hypothetical protein
MSFETRKLPLPPCHGALDHIMRAIDCVLACRNDPYYVPARADIESLRSARAAFGYARAAFGYARAITTYVLDELEHRIAGSSDELQRFRERYGE